MSHQEKDFIPPLNALELLEEAKAKVEARKAELLGNKEEAQKLFADAKLKAEQAANKLREITEQQAKVKRENEEIKRRLKVEAEDLKRKRDAEAAELAKSNRKKASKLEQKRLQKIATERAELKLEQREAVKTEAELPEAKTEAKTEPEASAFRFSMFSEPTKDYVKVAKRSFDKKQTIEQAAKLQAIKEIAKQRGDTIAIQSENEEDENLDAVGPFSLLAISPQGACDQYQKVRLNTMRHMMAGINRQIAKSVATENDIRIEEAKVRPRSDVDTLCIFTDEMRKDMMTLYRQKGWEVKIMKPEVIYVFKPIPPEE